MFSIEAPRYMQRRIFYRKGLLIDFRVRSTGPGGRPRKINLLPQFNRLSNKVLCSGPKQALCQIWHNFIFADITDNYRIFERRDKKERGKI